MQRYPKLPYNSFPWSDRGIWMAKTNIEIKNRKYAVKKGKLVIFWNKLGYLRGQISKIKSKINPIGKVAATILEVRLK